MHKVLASVVLSLWKLREAFPLLKHVIAPSAANGRGMLACQLKYLAPH